MNKELLKKIILDQKEEYLNLEFIKRDYLLEENVNYCFVGIRRSGKSFLMYQHIDKLIKSGIEKERIVFINFEDERLIDFSKDDFNLILEISLELTEMKKPFFFFDEIQNVEGWEKFVRRLADTKYIISITGSNSKMLSKDISSSLGARFITIPVYPYSFSEFLKANKLLISKISTTKDKAKVSELFDYYLNYGGLPEIVNIKNKRLFLNNIYKTIYIGDIVIRNKVENDFVLRLLLKKIAETIMRPISYTRLHNIIKTTGLKIGKQTIINYISYILNSLVIFELKNYASKLIDKETFPKYYFMDTGILGLFDASNKISSELENLVAIELIRRYGKDNVYYFEKDIEIDFYIPSESLAIQVSYSIFENDETYKKEINNLIKFNNYFSNTNLLVLTMSDKKTINIKGKIIEVLSLKDWLII